MRRSFPTESNETGAFVSRRRPHDVLVVGAVRKCESASLPLRSFLLKGHVMFFNADRQMDYLGSIKIQSLD